MWGSLCLFFSLFISSGAFMMVAIILLPVLCVLVVILGPQFVAASLLIGSPTIFGFPNEFLRPLPFVSMERLLLFGLIALVFLQYAFTKQKTKWLPVEMAIVVFLTYAFVNMVLHTDSLRYAKDGWLWVQYFMPMAGFIVSRRIAWSEARLRTLLAALTVAGVFLAISGILQKLFGIDFFTMNYQQVTQGHTGRAYGTFASAHAYIASLFIFLAITLLQFNLSRDTFMRFALISAMAVMSLGIILGATRAPWLGAALALTVIFVKQIQSRPLIIIGGLCGFFVVLVFFVIYIDYLGGFIERITNIRTLEGRAAAWATAVNMVAHNPLFGVGFGAFSFVSNKFDYITGIGSIPAEYAVFHGIPHNEYLHVAVLLGVTGLLLFLMILIRLVKLMFQIFENRNTTELRRHLALYSGAILMALMFNAFFSDTFMQDYFWLLAFFLAGTAAGGQELPVGRNEKNEPGDGVRGSTA